jgi:predicted lipid carrier protein YhbT
MIDTTQAFFDRLAERGYEPLLHHVSGTIRCDIEQGGSWFIVVDNGSLSVGRDALRADCVLACSREDFDRMVVGKQHPTTLFMQGRMRITGNLRLAQLFTRLFPDESLADPEQG